jgi:hypothetical protein
VASAGLGLHASAGHHDVKLQAVLTGLEEVPPISTNATAKLRASLNEAAKTVTFTLEYRDLATNLTAAHIHFGPRKVNGGIIAFFCGGGSSKPACPATTSGTVTGTITAADIVGPADQGIAKGDFARLVRAIKTGNAYANMHNERFPTGEVRGQIRAHSDGYSDAYLDGDDDDAAD